MILNVVFFTICGIGVLFFLVLSYTHNRQLRRDALQYGYHTKAIVQEYRSDLVRVAGSWTRLDYPYVAYFNAADELRLERLKYASSDRHLFWLGEEIDIVRYDGVVYYAPALYLPFWKHFLPFGLMRKSGPPSFGNFS